MHAKERNYNAQATWRSRAQTDPQEAHEIWAARHAHVVEDYLAGAMSRDCFAATLYALGFRNADLQGELAYYDHQRLAQGHAL